MTDWRDNAADQNLRMAAKMLEQQGEVNQLRARLAEVEAERDAARAKAEGVCLACPAERLAAENARLRQVVEAAEALIDWYRKMAGAPLHPQLDAFHPLRPAADAVDAYRAGQDSPASPPESTQGDEQAEPAVASTNTAQAQRGDEDPYRCGVCGWPYNGMDYCECPPPPADPPGLDAAIEAALNAVNTETPAAYRAHGVSWSTVAKVAVRAAAHGAEALRAGSCGAQKTSRRAIPHLRGLRRLRRCGRPCAEITDLAAAYGIEVTG